MKPKNVAATLILVAVSAAGIAPHFPVSAPIAMAGAQTPAAASPDGVTAADAIANRIERVLREVRQNTPMESAEPMPLDATTRLFADSLSATEATPELQQRWAAQGFVLESLANGEVLLVRERANRVQGRGVYAWRTARRDRPLVLQAPHRFYDRRTGQIVLRAFAESPVQAACWNSVHRRVTDLAHRTGHIFDAFTLAVAEQYRLATIVQLHGFDPSQRSGGVRTADAIVSDSTRYPGRRARQITLDLKQLWGKSKVLLYPIEASVLGGTQNAQARAVRATGYDRFIHLELSPAMRKQLAEEPRSRAEWLTALSANE